MDANQEISNGLAARRQAAGLTQAALAAQVGVSRQALNALEAGRSAPSMPVALRLSRALACSVESLFWLGDVPSTLRATWAGAADAPPGRALVGRVGDTWIAHPVPAGAGALRVSADAVRGPGGAAELALLRPEAELAGTLLCAGCAPALGLLGARLEAGQPGQRVHWLEHGSGSALALLAAGRVHIAGSHLLDEETGDYTLAELRRRLGRGDFEVYTLTRWEVGLVVRPGNPRGLRGVADLPAAVDGVVGREPGSGAERLLRFLLAGAGVPWSAVPFTPRPALGHLEAARRVAEGQGEVCVAIRSVALDLGLDFVPLAEERFDLVMPAPLATDPRVERLLDTLASRPFRRELESLGGHSTQTAAAHVGRLEAA
jgi:putative molybdopterin biosynthesis protein